MSFRPIDKRGRVPTAQDADPKGRVLAFHNERWVLADYSEVATFNGVQYWMHNKEVVYAPLRLPHS